MTVELDDRIRLLVERIAELSPEPPLLDGLTVGTIANRRIDRRRMLVPIVAMAVVAALVAMVAVVRRPDVSSAERLTVRSVATELPDGWVAAGAAESTRDPSWPTPRAHGVAYATQSLPLGPVVAIDLFSGSRLDTGQLTSQATLPDGRQVTTGTSLAGNRAADVEMADGQWVSIEATGIDLATLLRLAGQLVSDTAGARFEGALPDGLALVPTTSGLSPDQPLGYSPYLDPSSWPQGLAMTTYGPAGRPPSTWISMFPPDIDTNVLLAITRHPTRLDDDTYAAVDGNRRAVYRLVDGLVVWATSDTLDTSQLVDLVDGLRPVSDAEWARLSAAGTGLQDGSGPDATVVEGPATTVAHVDPGGTERSEVRVDYSVTSTSNRSVATARMPDGDEVRVEMRSVGRILHLTVSLSGDPLGTVDLDLSRQPGNGGGATSADGHGDGPLVFTVIDANPSSYAEMRIVDGPITYRAAFADLGDTGTKFAIIVVPPRSGRPTDPMVTVVDEGGNVVGP